MTLSAGFMRFFGKNKTIHPAQIIALVFAGLILLGTILLSLPVSSRSGISCGFRPALFTAASATCVTGLVLFDTWTQWSGFGQLVILALIEIGGLGFMSAASLIFFLLHKRIGLKQRLVMAQALSLTDMDDILRLQRLAVFGSLGIQAVGAVILTIRFLPEYGLTTALKWGCFHAVSAFCNAGFDIFGSVAPGSSLAIWNSDPVVLMTLGILIIAGGMGFLVWQELITIRNLRKCSVYTRLMIVGSGGLLVLGAVCFCVLEWSNPDTLGTMTPGDKLLNGFFQSVTLRTAGFAAVDQACLTEAGKGAALALMFIGGGSGSTAGGVKVVTLMVLFLFVWARVRGREQVCVFKRTIPDSQVMDAMTIVAILASLALFGGIFITATSPVSFVDGLFESVSALATVGVTAGVTPKLSAAAQYLMILYMYFGRVGVLTISLGFLMGNGAQERFHYARTSLLIG